MKKQTLTLMSLLLIIAIVLSACGSPAATPAEPTKAEAEPVRAAQSEVEKPAKLSFWHIYADTDANKGLVIKDIASSFTDSTGIEIELSQIKWQDHVKRMMIAGVAQDKTPDVFVSGHTRPGLEGMVDADFLLPLDDYVTQEQIDQYLPALIEQVTIDGKLYALPQEVQVVALVPNGAVLDELGISRETPATMEELEAVFDKIKDAGIPPIGLILGGGSFSAEWLFNILASRAITQEQMDAITAGEASFSEAAMPVLETLERWAAKDYFDPNAAAMDWGATTAAHYAKEIGVMGVGGFWPASLKTTNQLEDLDWPIWVTPPLVENAPKQVAGGLWWGVSVNARTENPEYAVQLALAMTDKGYAEQWLDRTDNLAAADIPTDHVTFSPLIKYLDILKEYSAFWPNIPAEIASDYGDAMVSLVTGQISAQEAGERIDALFASLNQ